ncbi:MAG: hypothetical protein M0P58_09440 [Bacteroidales bacterium]|jgi:hypothetical protein|nr:hypothetical protein [Bacteroidales bacterium]
MKKSISFTIPCLFMLSCLFVSCAKDTGNNSDPTNARAKYLGKWSVSEVWTKLSYEVTISADPNSESGVFIYNFANTGSSGTPAGALISGTTITLDPDQTIGEGWIVNGGGIYSNSKIIWNYTINDGATRIDATATYTKQ